MIFFREAFLYFWARELPRLTLRLRLPRFLMDHKSNLKSVSSQRGNNKLVSLLYTYFIFFSGKPKSLPQLEALPEDLKNHVTLFRRIEDFQKLDNISNNIQSITIFGGGFLGSELACALGHRGRQEGAHLEVKVTFHMTY